jgi:hypothetical protein
MNYTVQGLILPGQMVGASGSMDSGSQVPSSRGARYTSEG